MSKKIIVRILFFILIFLFKFFMSPAQNYFSPADLEVDPKTNELFVIGESANEIRKYGLLNFELKQTCETRLPPKALKITGKYLLVATSYSTGELLVLNKNTLQEEAIIPLGHGACDIAATNDVSKIFVANRYSNDISVVDLSKKKELTRIPVLRQPSQIQLSKNGKYLFAANFLTSGSANVDTVTAEVSIIDVFKEKVIKNIPLANGSNALRGMAISPDGKYVFISHNLGRFQVPTTQLEQGWMNTSALSVIDAQSLEYIATVLLDEPEYGAAGSWGISCTNKFIFVAHSGTHDFSQIDYQAFINKLKQTENKASLSYNLRFLSGIRSRIKVGGNGPRAITINDNKLLIANYFTDEIEKFDILSLPNINSEILRLSEKGEPDEIRLGEIYFNDATYCFQGWQSCNGCHPDNARTDAMNWDLLNDGMGNPKNCKSMLLAHKTPPVMVTGIRPNAEAAVRAGFNHIQFVQIEEKHAQAVDAYLKSLKPLPSPCLVNGKLSSKAQKGKIIFNNAGCGNCHYGEYFTDLKKHTIGTQGEFDHQNSWDTPTLIEVWRTAPYLHDGRSAQMKDVFMIEKHGINKNLSEKEIDQLVEYILSL